MNYEKIQFEREIIDVRRSSYIKQKEKQSIIKITKQSINLT
jgi:hypothetical protein